MKKKVVRCTKCLRDITEEMHLYKKGEVYCYDCFHLLKPKRKPNNPEHAMVRKMYQDGMKPTVIAKLKGMTVEKVYSILNREDKA